MGGVLMAPPVDPLERGLVGEALEALHAERPRLGVALVCGDGIEALARLPPGCADCLIVDPPYGLSNGGTTVQSGKRVAVDKGTWDHWPSIEAYAGWSIAWLRLAQRALKRTGTIWISGTHHAIFAIGLAVQRLDFNVLNLVTWCKPNASPNLGCRQLTHSSEMVIWAAPKIYKPLAHTFNYAELRAENGGKQLRDVWEFPAGAPAAEKTEGKHATQKPRALVERMIRASTRPGDMVIDPFSGSGTVSVCAAALGRLAIGVERDKVYHRVAMRRVRALRE